jgi:hypothetical protein
MSHTTEHVERLRELTRILNPQALDRRIREHTRGGLPGTSLNNGSRGAEPPLPAFDPTDQQALNDWPAYTTAIARATTALEGAWRIQNGWLQGRATASLDDTPTTTVADDACPSCARLNTYTPRAQGGNGPRALCTWCDNWNRIHATWPAEELLDAHHRGIRITTTLVERIMRVQSTTKPKRKRARR